MNGLAIIETRPLPNIREIVENHIRFTGWPVTFFHGLSNGDFVKTALKGLDVKFREVRFANLTTSDYNRLLTSKQFWNAIPYERVLIFQHDSRLLRKGIEEFLEWDYVGSPWKFQKYGGNGGLSLRNKAMMLEVIDLVPYRGVAIHGNEDVYFCNLMHQHDFALMAPRDVCSDFACESIFKRGTFGYHAIEKYLTPLECREIKMQYAK